jgi:2,4-dienoyl-CoA reductase-like NADH-dependent reductase (Old Yellow Enzyme family)
LQDKLHRARKLAPQVPVCIQLAHAGRKASSAAPWQGGQLLSPEQGGWPTVGPSAVPHLAQEAAPHALDAQGLTRIKQAFVKAAQRADAMGIEAIELHGAHGYLLHQFLSPIANHRTDNYGGNFDNRTRFPMEVFEAVRAVYKGTLGMRISASDWVDNGWTPEETADFSLRLKLAGADFVHISSGGVAAQQKIALGPDYQVPFAKLVKQKTKMPTIAVGLITEPLQAENILVRGDADLIALARAFLYKPRWVWEAAAALNGKVQASPQYWRCMPREAQGIFESAHMGQR